LGYLDKVNYKFKNYGQASILGSERIISSVFQPEFRYKDDGILGKLFIRSISTAHLVILTDREVILVQEPKEYRGYNGLFAPKRPRAGGEFVAIAGGPNKPGFWGSIERWD
jgi:hypothetical protein